jgi:hypothetical protein
MDLLAEADLDLADEDQLLEWFAIRAANIDLVQLDQVSVYPSWGRTHRKQNNKAI